MLAAAIDTRAATIEWALSELIKCPRIMKKVRQELDDVLLLVNTKWLTNQTWITFEYLDMVRKETFRLHAVAPLLVHESM